MPNPVFYDPTDDFSVQNRQRTIKNVKLLSLTVKGEHYKANHMHFRSVEFTGYARFENLQIRDGMAFEDCIFHEGLLFSNITSLRSDPEIALAPATLLFRRCTFQEFTYVKGMENSLDYGIIFEDCIFHHDLSINNLTAENNGIQIYQCTLKESLEIIGCRSKDKLNINSCGISGNVKLQDIDAEELRLIGENVFSGFIILSGSTFGTGITFFNGLFREEIYFSDLGTGADGALKLFHCQFEKPFSITYSEDSAIAAYYINGVKFSGGLHVNNSFIKNGIKPRTRLIELELSPRVTGQIVFSFLDVLVIDIRGFNSSANINFNLIEVCHLKINSFINSGGLIFSSLRTSRNAWIDDTRSKENIKSLLYIEGSNLGKAQFFQTLFDSFERIIFHDVIFTEIATSMVSWFTTSQLEDGRIEKTTKDLKQAQKSKSQAAVEDFSTLLIDQLGGLREIYRQLKFAAQKQGDIPLSLEFQRHEMNYYRRIISLKKPRQWSEYLILVSSQSNNFGQSWLRALFGLLVFSFICFLPLAFFGSTRLDYGRFANSLPALGDNFLAMYENLNYWTVLLNPAHRIKDFSDDIDHFPKIIYLFDLLSRVVVSYFLFQMISAFRKFSR